MIREYKTKRENYHIGLRLSDLESCVKTQLECSPQDDDYMRGMANGLLMAWSIMAEPYGEDVQFIESPKLRARTDSDQESSGDK